MAQMAHGMAVRMGLHPTDLFAVMDISDFVYVLDFGERIAGGEPQEVAKDPAVIEAYVGDEEVLV